MNGATVIDVQASFVNPENDVVDRELTAPVSEAAETVVNLITTIGYVVMWFCFSGWSFAFLVHSLLSWGSFSQQ